MGKAMVLSQPELSSPPSPGAYGDPQRTGRRAQDLRDRVTEHMFFTLGCSVNTVTPHDLYMTLSHAVRDHLMARSLASQEASGSSNMKLAMNSVLTIGTLDGANIEIRARVGANNFLPIGHDAAGIQTLMEDHKPWQLLARCPQLQQASSQLESGAFSHGDRELYQPLLHYLRPHKHLDNSAHRLLFI